MSCVCPREYGYEFFLNLVKLIDCQFRKYWRLCVFQSNCQKMCDGI